MIIVRTIAYQLTLYLMAAAVRAYTHQPLGTWSCVGIVVIAVGLLLAVEYRVIRSRTR